MALQKYRNKRNFSRTPEPRGTRAPGKTNEELQSAPEEGADSLPEDISPMLATLAKEPFDRWGWLFELKWDGYRTIARVDKGDVHLRSRSNVSFDEDFSPIRDALRGLRHRAVIDGEIVALDEEGRARFSLLQRHRRSGARTLAFYAFDLLYLDGHSLLDVSLRERKLLLKQLLQTTSNPAIRFSSHIEHDGRKLFKKALEQGLEGIVGKNGESRYVPGRRSREWVKVKTHMRQEAVIGGFAAPRGSSKHIGAPILGVYEGDRFIHIGDADGKITDEDLPALQKKLQPLITPKCPFEERPQANMPPTWVRPELVCEVEFSEWTPDGRMRHPVYLGLREDRDPKEVVRERPAQERGVRLLDQAFDRTALTVGRHEVTLTNLKKTYWPEEGITKGDLIDYYRAIAPVLVPYLMDRPENLHRFPNGIADEGFFEKDVPKEKLPPWVKTAGIYSESSEAKLTYLVCDSDATLLCMVNLGCIEFNPWNARVGSLERPDYIVIDLDPVGVPFSAVVQTAVAVKGVLDDLDIPGFPKTSGATGIHIYVSLGARYPWEQARQLSELIAALTHERLPELTSLERNPAKRRGKVYLDFLQNRRGQTLAAPYCVRPLPGAPVSTPLAWEEVHDGLNPNQFTIHTIFDRLRRTGDLWRNMLSGSLNIADIVWLLGK